MRSPRDFVGLPGILSLGPERMTFNLGVEGSNPSGLISGSIGWW
jgi:hypothetical protein